MAASTGAGAGAASSNETAKLPKAVGVDSRPSISVEHVPTNRSPRRFARQTQRSHDSTHVENIPRIYWIWHLYLEPLTALGGVYHLHWVPEQYFAYMPQTSRYAPESQIICDQLAASYLFFAVIEALVLRTTTEITVWRAALFALLLCDGGHLFAAWAEMGTHLTLSPWLWTVKDTVTMMLNIIPAVLRTAFLLGMG
jgi:hypothetical protein